MNNFFYDILTVFWRDWLVLKRTLVKFMLSRMITPFLYILAFGLGLGRNISVDGGSYLNFIIPGMIAMNSMNIAFSTVANPLNMARLYYHTLETYVISPISSWAFIWGKVLSGIVRGLISTAIILLIAYALGVQVCIGGWFLPLLILNCGVFAALAIVAAMAMSTHEDMANFSTYFLVPMSFLCGTFFKNDGFPVAIKYFLTVLPLTPASNALRAVGNAQPVDWQWPLLMGFYFILFMCLAYWFVAKKREE
ncbi:MAG: ABC transporter permease [Acidaminococcaceae bacterium]